MTTPSTPAPSANFHHVQEDETGERITHQSIIEAALTAYLEAAADHARRAGELDRAAAAEERSRLLGLVDGLSAEIARLQAASVPTLAPSLPSESDELEAMMAAELARLQAEAVPLLPRRRGFLSRLLRLG
jgi:DNA-directed RNA polymerase subunit F